MEQLSISDRWHSKRNRVFFWLRNQIQFQRRGYKEGSSEPLDLPVTELSQFPQLKNLQPKLSSATFRKNLSTLYTLQKIFENSVIEGSQLQDILEVGAQDFSRAPALASFFSANISALEIDAFPILANLHSRIDKARYFQELCSLISDKKMKYQVGDFFQHTQTYDLVLCFYPFVSPHPSLAWGLPAEMGNAEQWNRSLIRCTKPQGLVLLVHQGDWEQSAFDEVRDPNHLELLSRKVLPTPYESLPHPPHVSLYRRT